MSIPVRQQLKVASYIIGRRLRGVTRYPLTLMLEPLFQCNLACPGCGMIHHDIKEIVEGIIARGKYIYLCTNAILMEKKLDLFTPSDHLTFSVHLDGMRERHDESVGREGIFDVAVSAIRVAKKRGFRVNINTTLFTTAKPDEVAEFFDFATYDLGVDGITFSPGYHYEHAPRQDVFMGRRQS